MSGLHKSNSEFDEAEKSGLDSGAIEELEELEEFDRASIKNVVGFDVVFEGDAVEFVGHCKVNIKTILLMEKKVVKNFKKLIYALAKIGRYKVNTISDRIAMLDKALRGKNIKQFTHENYPALIEGVINNSANAIGGLFTTWHSLNIPGVSAELVDAVRKNWRPYDKGQSRAASADVNISWYSDQEYDALVSMMWNDYDMGVVSLQNTVAALLNAQYGRRPKQLANLKIMDFEISGETQGVHGKRVCFPAAKERHSGEFRDGKFEVHAMGDDLWELCQIQIKKSTEHFEAFFGKRLEEKHRIQLPFFQDVFFQNLSGKKQMVDARVSQENYYYSVIWHKKSKALANMISGNHRTKVFSERTGNLVHEFPYRMRHTRARQLARLGVPRKVLQYWLGHEGSISLDSYYDDPAERARTLNNKVSEILAPLAQAFTGLIRDEEFQAIRGNDPTSRIELDGRKGVGTCGHSGFCSASVPIPCYRCSKFQPWVYGPHEEVLVRLIDRQAEENNINLPSKARRLLTPIQLDKDIHCVRVIIALCEKRKKELEDK